ncbi:MAG: TIGR01212 family radical SAM protein [Oscillospiraceae bacterium]|nr:TIGR01212 family radical SAM protein [Oscillospiraceae bacterium]
MYRTLSQHYRERFGCKVYKLSLDAGFTCPNRDGTLDTRGCIFCSAYGGGEFAEGLTTWIPEQLEKAKARVRSKNRDGKYIAYFQSFTNTYAPVDHLRQLYTAAMAPDDIVGLAIGTRPDCLPEDVIALLKELNAIKPITIELGLQTIHETSAQYIRRGYLTSVYDQAVSRLHSAGIEVVTHIILGLPGEDQDMMVQTTRHAVAMGTDGIKFHLLHVLRGTDLEKDYLSGKFQCLTLEAYGQHLKACLSVLPPHVTVHRITGDGAKRDLVAPLWSADKKRVLNYLNSILTLDDLERSHYNGTHT